MRNNKPWISDDLAKTQFPLDRKLLHEGIRSTISIPLYHDRMLGVFNFDSTVPAQYSEQDLDVLLMVAKHIARALENALLFEEISKEKKEWERTSMPSPTWSGSRTAGRRSSARTRPC